jgi:Icc-related predicted phosphoesterase
MGGSELTRCFFTSDLHGDTGKYDRLFRAIREEVPEAVFIGGDLLPSALRTLHSLEFDHQDFVNDYLAREMTILKEDLGQEYPVVFLILGNDDGRFEEASIEDVASGGLWRYAGQRALPFGEYTVYGYPFIPPSPFRLKDWEKYDVSRFVDPGCVSPEEGARTVSVAECESRFGTIEKDLGLLTGNAPMENALFLFHAPPYNTMLDRAELDGMMVDHAPVDVHVGSIAVERFIRDRQPLLTMHGHVHESARLTGSWMDRIGRTVMLGAAHDGPELALIRFEPENPGGATRELVS